MSTPAVLAAGGELIQLSEDTAERVRAILREGTNVNTRAAYEKDLRYFWTWAGAALGLAERYPVPVAAVVKFAADHLTGLEPHVEKHLVDAGVKRPGVHSLNSIRRRLAAISVAHKGQATNPCKAEQVRELLRRAERALATKGVRPRQKRAATRDVLEAMCATCTDGLIGIRDCALLLFAAGSGGRRRSEVCAVRAEDLVPVADGFLVLLRRSKTDQRGEGRMLPILGAAGRALKAWLAASAIEDGPLFRAIDRGGRVLSGLCDRTVARIVQRRARLAGFDATEFGGHSMRSGFISECGRQNIALLAAMELSGHRTVTVASRYHQAGAIMHHQAARLFG